MELIVLISFISAGVSLGIGGVIYGRNPMNIENRLSFLFCITASLWAFTHAEFLQAPTYELAAFWDKLSIFWPLTLSFFLHLTIIRIGEARKLVNRVNYVFIYGPALIFGFIDGFYDAITTAPVKASWGWVDHLDSTIPSYIVIIWILVVICWVLIKTIQFYKKQPENKQKKHFYFILLGYTPVVVLGGLTDILFPLIGIDFPSLTIPGFIIFAITSAYSMLRYESFALTATNVAKDILETMSDYLFLVSPEGLIQQANNLSLKNLGYSEREMIGLPFTNLFIDYDVDQIFIPKSAFNNLSTPNILQDRELNLITKNYQEIPVSLSNSLLIGPDQTLNGMVYIARDITERRQVQAALRESQAKYWLLVEHSKDGIFIIQDGLCAFCNNSFSELIGYPLEEIIGNHISEFMDVESRNEFVNYLSTSLSGNDDSKYFETKIKHRSGLLMYVELVLNQIPYGESYALMGTVRDIQDRKKAEIILKEAKTELEIAIKERTAELHFSNEQLLREIAERKLAEVSIQRRLYVEKVMSEISTHLMMTAKLESGINNSLKRIGELLQVDQVSIYLFDNSKTKLSRKYDWRALGTFTNVKQNQELNIDQIPWWMKQLNIDNSITIPDISLLSKKIQIEIENFNIHNVQALFVLPIYNQLNINGFLGIYDFDRTRNWVQEDLHILRVCAELIGVTIERKQAESVLKENENRYRLLTDNVHDIIWTMDLNLNYTYISSSVERLTGYSPEETLKMTINQILTPGSQELVMKTFAEEMALETDEDVDLNRSILMELEQITKDGNKIWVEIQISGIRDDNNNLVEILGITRDITRRKQIEDELQEIERRYHLLIENVTDIIWTTDLQLNFTYVSPSITSLLGYDVDKVLTFTFGDILTPTSLESAQQLFNERLAAEIHEKMDQYQTLRLKLGLIHKNGSIIWTESIISFLRDFKKEIVGLVGVSRDITL